MDMQMATSIVIAALILIAGYLIVFTNVQIQLPAFVTFENFKAPKDVRKLQLSEIGGFSEAIKDELFAYANARGEYKHTIINGVLMPIGNALTVLSTFIAPALLLDNAANTDIASLLEVVLPYLQWSILVLMIPLTIFKLYRANPLQAIILRGMIRAQISYFAKSYQFDVTAINHEALWVQVIKTTQQNQAPA